MAVEYEQQPQHSFLPEMSYQQNINFFAGLKRGVGTQDRRGDPAISVPNDQYRLPKRPEYTIPW